MDGSNNNDTDTLLALVSSLLVGKVHKTDAILDALVQCDGDVEATAHLLNDNAKTKKRKRVQLDDWLQRPSSSSKSSKSSLSQSIQNPDPNGHSNVASSASKLQSINSSDKRTLRLPPLILSNPEMVDQNTPCTLHLSVLPPELACRLFYTMVHASRDWRRNKWWLFDRVVESPHRSAFFVRKSDGIKGNESWRQESQFWYNGRATEPPDLFPPAMEEACDIIERIVNEQLKQRTRFPLEWGGGGTDQAWRANVAGSNCYEGSQETVGFHSDQLTYLGPYPTIASLSLGTQRIFSLREVIPVGEANTRRARTFNIPLVHNSLTIMHASCQERFKHSIPPQSTIDLYHPTFPESPGLKPNSSNCRINITFRFFRPDFQPSSIPRCRCGVPMVLRPDMKNRSNGTTDRYWWSCHAGAQNEGKGCNRWKIMDMTSEGRGPCVADDVHTGGS